MAEEIAEEERERLKAKKEVESDQEKEDADDENPIKWAYTFKLLPLAYGSHQIIHLPIWHQNLTISEIAMCGYYRWEYSDD